ncbi:MAG: glycosyltransferase [Candidatus Marinimicrobia bacterium]|nr:glycosyltransferase [Candidatus Neomarinimicrobiota bacterium]
MYLADGASVHTRKWIRALAQAGYCIHLFSLNRFDPEDYGLPEDRFSYSVHSRTKNKTIWGGINKLHYLVVLKELNNKIREFKPDILHAHFASSYGTLAARTGFHPCVISVWGYDVFVFPRRSCLHREILKKNFSAADRVLSTSRVMAEETQRYTLKQVEVTPFGVDVTRFYSRKGKAESKFMFPDGKNFIIGTAKPLEEKYAVDDLIRSFAILHQRFPGEHLCLVIAGKGSAEASLKDLARKLGVWEKVEFSGQLKHEDMPEFYNAIDVFAALSLEESFGVAVIEAAACEKAVVVSDAGGLPEVVQTNVTGYVVPRRNPEAAADAFERLLRDASLRTAMGKAGREYVIQHYEWSQCVRRMADIYQTILSEKSK